MSERPRSTAKYKIKLRNDRVLGPVDIALIAEFILRGHITGSEKARHHPGGEWRNIESFPEIGDLLLLQLQGRLEKTGSRDPSVEHEVKTLLVAAEPGLTGSKTIHDDEAPTAIGERPSPVVFDDDLKVEMELKPIEVTRPNVYEQKTSEQKTIAMNSLTRPKKGVGFRVPSPKEILIVVFLSTGLAWVTYDMFFSEPPPKSQTREIWVRAFIPERLKKINVIKSKEALEAGMSHYLKDNVPGYLTAVGYFKTAAEYDQTNKKALALLASSFLNLMDASNKDDRYFSVIRKLIQMSKEEDSLLSETVLAEVEFYIAIKKLDAGLQVLEKYFRSKSKHDEEVYYFFAELLVAKGDYERAFLAIKEHNNFEKYSPRVEYLRGVIAEKYNRTDEAIGHYTKAIQFQKEHPKSILRLATLLIKSEKSKNAIVMLDFLKRNQGLMTRPQRAEMYSLYAKEKKQRGQTDGALADLQEAVELDRGNMDYLVDIYALQASAQGASEEIKHKARMFYFLSQGQQNLKDGRYQEALNVFMEASHQMPSAYQPWAKIGEVWYKLNNFGNAKAAYEKALKLAGNNLQVRSRYVQLLIENYEWSEVKRELKLFQSQKGHKAAYFKLMGDFFFRQAQFKNALDAYKKAMTYDEIDNEVYLSYAKTLKALLLFEDAQFYFSLASRYDPANVQILNLTAECIADAESVDRAIAYLEEQAKSYSNPRPELLTQIGVFKLRKRDLAGARASIQKATDFDPQYSRPWLVLADIYMAQKETDKKAVEKALAALESYTQRNLTDPEGYLRRYDLLRGLGRFDAAMEELAQIYTYYPRFPRFHLLKGNLYKEQRNQTLALEEYLNELKNNPDDWEVLNALGEQYVLAGDYNKASAQFSRAMAVAPGMAKPKKWAGYNYLKMNNPNGAIAMLNEALRYEKGDPEILEYIGWAYVSKGDFAAASGAFKQVLMLDPNYKNRATIEKHIQR